MTHRAKQLFGKTLKTLSLNGLILTETQYPPYSKLPEHSHAFAYFCFVLQGAFTEKYGKQNRLCAPSTSIFHTRSTKRIRILFTMRADVVLIFSWNLR